VAEVASRLGVTPYSLYQWLKRYGNPKAEAARVAGQETEIRRLKAERKRVTEERDILKRPPVSSIDRCNTLCPATAFGGGAYGANGEAGTLGRAEG
jgi:transposase-like protein